MFLIVLRENSVLYDFELYCFNFLFLCGGGEGKTYVKLRNGRMGFKIGSLGIKILVNRSLIKTVVHQKVYSLWSTYFFDKMYLETF